MTAEARSGCREIDHTADLGVEVWAEDWPTLVDVATRAVAGLCYDLDGVAEREQRRLLVRGADREELLVRWLHEVYLALEIEGFLTASVDSVAVREGTLGGILRGERLDHDRHVIHTEIKAITYHRLRLERGADGLLRTWLIVDV